MVHDHQFLCKILSQSTGASILKVCAKPSGTPRDQILLLSDAIRKERSLKLTFTGHGKLDVERNLTVQQLSDNYAGYVQHQIARFIANKLSASNAF